MENPINNNQRIFLSYCWADTDDVNRLDNQFLRFGIRITRDVRDLAYDENIHDFMNRVKSHDKIVLYISDSYLRSVNCMYEAAQVLTMQDSVIVIVKSGTKLFDVKDKSALIKYWNEKLVKLSEMNLTQYQDEIADTRIAQQSIAEFINFVKKNYRMTSNLLDFDVLLDRLQLEKEYPTIINEWVYAWIAKYPRARLSGVLALVNDLYKSTAIIVSEFPNIPDNETLYFFKNIEFEPEKNGITLRLSVSDPKTGLAFTLSIPHMISIEVNSMRSDHHSKYYFHCENPYKKQRALALQYMDYRFLSVENKEILNLGYTDTYRMILHF